MDPAAWKSLTGTVVRSLQCFTGSLLILMARGVAIERRIVDRSGPIQFAEHRAGKLELKDLLMGQFAPYLVLTGSVLTSNLARLETAVSSTLAKLDTIERQLFNIV